MPSPAPFLHAAPLRLALLAAALAPALALAVVGRADQDDARRLELGRGFTAAARILPDGGGTLIAPTWVLTAAHVAAGLPAHARLQFGAQEVAVRRVIIHPEGHAPRGQPPEVDLALLELAQPVRGVQPVALYRGRDELGKQLTIVGYGDFGSPAGALARGDGKPRAVTNTVDDAGPRRLFLRFDAPPAGTPDEGVGGPGDSGGPAFIESKHRLFVAGVSSASMDGKPGQYGVTDVYTRVSSYADWIEASMRAR